MVKARKFEVEQFKGEPKLQDFRIVEEDLPDLKDSEFLAKAEWWSVDPHMRTKRAKDGSMVAAQVARIIESRNQDFPVGELVVGNFGWRDVTVVDMSRWQDLGPPKPYLIQDFKGLPSSLALGMLGRPGNSAYFPFLEICKPKPGDTVVVSGAAGAVGSHVGQIARIKGCRVIGFAGSDEKVRWLKDELHFDKAYNYKTISVGEALKDGAANGVDCYFDCVGGEMSSAVIAHMNHGGRIAVAGSISAYNATTPVLAPVLQPHIIFNELKMEGFLVLRWIDRWSEGIEQNLQWCLEGKLKYREHITEGFDNMPRAFIGLFRGENIGKAVVKA